MANLFDHILHQNLAHFQWVLEFHLTPLALSRVKGKLAEILIEFLHVVEVDVFNRFRSKLVEEFLLRISLEISLVLRVFIVVVLLVFAAYDCSVFVVGTIILPLFLGLSSTFLMIVVIVVILPLANVKMLSVPSDSSPPRGILSSSVSAPVVLFLP